MRPPLPRQARKHTHRDFYAARSHMLTHATSPHAQVPPRPGTLARAYPSAAENCDEQPNSPFEPSTFLGLLPTRMTFGHLASGALAAFRLAARRNDGVIWLINDCYVVCLVARDVPRQAKNISTLLDAQPILSCNQGLWGYSRPSNY
jgi:hypothetical protein